MIILPTSAGDEMKQNQFAYTHELRKIMTYNSQVSYQTFLSTSCAPQFFRNCFRTVDSGEIR